ncbi:MAG: amino acid ABC transporter permease [Gammaproteobacteria bacterium]
MKTPPPLQSGFLPRLKGAFFATPGHALLTMLSLAFIWLMAESLTEWLVLDAVFVGKDREACAAGGGMCWPFVAAKMELWIYGRYPIDQRWRADASFALLAFVLLWLAMARRKGAPGFLAAIMPFAVYVLLYGGVFGLPKVPTQLWGGVLLTLVIAVTGNAASLPLAVLLALGRRAKTMPAVRLLCAGIIEFVRGAPLITLLFMASVMLPLFLPEGATVNQLLRALFAVALFQGAALAEVVRGGLQALPPGQEESGKALGLSYWHSALLIVLPQALKICIPGIVNSYIALLKDTTLVLIVGLFDVLGMVQLTTQDPKWLAPTTTNSGYFVVAAFFWLVCFLMSRYSRALEQKLAKGDFPDRRV